MNCKMFMFGSFKTVGTILAAFQQDPVSMNAGRTSKRFLCDKESTGDGQGNTTIRQNSSLLGQQKLKCIRCTI